MRHGRPGVYPPSLLERVLAGRMAIFGVIADVSSLQRTVVSIGITAAALDLCLGVI